MKKKQVFLIANKVRKTAVSVSVLMIMLFSASLVILGIIGVPVSRTVTKATCNTVTEIGYDLVFEEDPLYNENELEFGDGYVTKYVDAIDLDFLYHFSCAGAEDMSGTYSVGAELEATYNDVNLIWKKEFSLIPEMSFTSEQLAGSYFLPLYQYGKIAEDIEMNTGVNTSAIMTITLTVNSSAVVDGTPISDTSVSTLVFDLSENVLVMGGEPKQERSTPIEETQTRDLVPKKTALFIFAPPLFLSACALAFLLIYTRGVKEDPVKLQLSRLYKKYGSRIAELEPGPDILRHNPIMVRSFKDLLLTADELKKPIFKKNADDSVDVEFYVIDEVEIYIFSAHSLMQLQKEK